MVTENRFLENPKTGQKLRWNPVLAKRPDLIPCNPPWEDQEKGADGPVMQDPAHRPTDEPPAAATLPDPPPDETLLSKEEAAKRVKDWFGRDVSRVTVADIRVLADDKQVELPEERLGKLELVTLLDAGLKAKGE